MKFKVDEKRLGGGLCTCMLPFTFEKSEEKDTSKSDNKDEKKKEENVKNEK